MSTADKPVGSGATPTDITPAASGTAPAPASRPTAVTERPGLAPDGDAIRLHPQPPRAAAPGGVSTLVPVLDAILLVLVLALAVFAAAAPIRDSDVLRHLAAGRALVEGRYNPVAGTDPFAATTEGMRWVNPSWLYDLLSYEVYSTANRIHDGAGIPTLAVFHALLVIGLTLVLVSVGRGAGGPIVSILCVALALLVMSPYLRIDPAIVSLLFLGLTLWLLQRGGRWLAVPGRAANAVPGEPVTWKDYWLLLPLFALWANLDEWFLLGPLTVGLYALGQALQPESTEGEPVPRTPCPGEVGALGVIFVAGLAACLVNPHHVFVFALPSGLGFSATASVLQKDPTFGETFTSPLREAFQPDRVSVVGLAYIPLILVGLLSFGLNYKELRWWRVLTFGFFLLLSAIAVRTVPFFAVVAGLVMALNFHDLAEQSLAARGGRRRRERAGGRALVALLLLLLLAVGWSGHLHAKPYEQHRVSFANELDPSFERAAKWIKEQREKGILDRGFVSSPDLADALALYCPEEKGFLDHRFGLFGDVANDFVTVREALRKPPPVREALQKPPSGPETKDWQQVLEKHGIDHVVLYALSAEELRYPYRNLSLEPRRQEPKDWVELYRDGRTVVFGWAKKRPAYRQHRLDVERLAYSSATVEKVPEEGMSHLPGSEPFWMPYLQSAGARPLESDEAALHILAFEVELGRTSHQREAAWEAALTTSALAEVRPGPVPMAPACLLVPTLAQALEGVKARPQRKDNPFAVGSVRFLDHFLRSFDSASPAHLLLAVRAARKALAKDPNDAYAHLQLGKAYLYLSEETRERLWDPERALLGDLHFIQAVTSFNQVILLKPPPRLLKAAHGELMRLYGINPGFKDLQLRHYQGMLAATRTSGPDPGETPAVFNDRVEGLTKVVDQMAQEVGSQRDKFKNRKARLGKVMQRVQGALNMNLAREALDTLRDSEVADFGPEGMQFQIELALHMGLVRDVRTWFDDAASSEEEEKQFIRNLVQRDETLEDGVARYYRFKGLLSGAIGDYAAADHCFAEIETRLDQAINSFDQEKYLSSIGKVTGAKKKQPPVLAIKEVFALAWARAIIEDTKPPETAIGLLQAGIRKHRPEQVMDRTLIGLMGAIGDRAKYTALRGVLALEVGDLAKAERLFRQALLVWRPDPGNDSVVGIDFPYRSMVQEYLETLARYK